jgi:Ni,Fe-hydrogenase I cytochrome b subunit
LRLGLWQRLMVYCSLSGSGWMRARNRITGAAMITIFGILILTSLILYYGSEESHLWARWVHIAIGLLSFGAFPIHIVYSERPRLPDRLTNPGR